MAYLEALTLFARIGRAFFGSHWQSDLARTIAVNLRTVRRWGAGQERTAAGRVARARGNRGRARC